MIPIWAFNSDSKTTEDHKNNPRLHNHIRKVMGGVGQAVAGLDDIPKTAPALEDLGYVHKQYGPTDNHYDVSHSTCLGHFGKGGMRSEIS